MANPNLQQKTAKSPLSGENDPCVDELGATNACLRYNNKDECMQYVMNLKFCKEFWSQIKEIRKRDKIEPHLPAVEDRPKILKDNYYLLAGKMKNWEDYVPESLR